jgi:hypothetical protein
MQELREEIIGYFHDDKEITYEEIAKDWCLTKKMVLAVLVGSGLRERDIFERNQAKWEKENMPKLWLTIEGEIDKCCQCEIYLVEKESAVPEDWEWKTSGRFGDICMACAREMKAKHKARMGKLAELGCVVCLMETGFWVNPEIHHVRDKLGVGQKRNHDMTIPLCPNHHRTGGHGESRHASKEQWELSHGNEVYLLGVVNGLIGEF